MKKIIILSIITLFAYSCSKDFIEKDPYGVLTDQQILSTDNLEGLVISAYSILNGQMDQGSNAYNSPASNWSFGDVTSDDMYKGGGGTGDQHQIHLMEIFNITPDIYDIERKWLALYEGVHRANLAIHALDISTEIDPDLKSQRIAEMRFLRGHFYFELKKIYNQIPYLDENDLGLEDIYVSNTEYTSEELWGKIEDDFKAAYAVLPSEQSQPGRPTKWAAQAYLCKTYIYQQKWHDAITAANDVIDNGGYSLMQNFNEVFLPENDNGPEVVFAIQYSINDGSPRNYNGSIGDRLIPPGGPRYAGYGFERPSQSLINAYETDPVTGLPVVGDSVQAGDYLDPRVDYTAGRPGIPYKDLGILYEASWARDLATYGPYGPKKRVLSANSPYYLPHWPYVVATNFYIIRYADVLLWKAEALIETDDLEGGRHLINMIRRRAHNSNYVQNLDGTGDADNYAIGEYTNSFNNYTEAINALRLERRLEFAHEGQRFFDLVRWGIADSVLNSYFASEQKLRGYLVGAHFTPGKNEYMPIPQAQIDLGKGLITQNPGY
jgi:hypothetical protein